MRTGRQLAVKEINEASAKIEAELKKLALIELAMNIGFANGESPEAVIPSILNPLKKEINKATTQSEAGGRAFREAQTTKQVELKDNSSRLKLFIPENPTPNLEILEDKLKPTLGKQ